ncbi:MAG: leucine-rich repeat domain-containing protein, partial [Ureaplasma sp.]|nr:leucine-rich repeat domain-containing protein [Ureaplasma sp.]
NTTIALDKISSVAINANNQLEITLDTTLTKYTISAYTNAELNSNKLIIKNLNYFNLISISDTNLNNLRTSIQDYITNNQVTVDNVNNHITNINSLVSSVKTTNNQNLGNFVGSVTYSNNAFTIPLNSNTKMNVKSLTNIQVNVNSIAMSNFNFYFVSVAPQESPEDWFIWTGSNSISGLSALGLQQKHIVLPSKIAKFSKSYVFYKNKTLVSIDMSLTSLTSTGISLDYIGDSIFNGCSSLTSVILPKTLTSIGQYAFANCTSLTSITIPNSVTTIWHYAFSDSGLTSIILPDSLKYPGVGVFAGCSSLTSVRLPFPNLITGIKKSTFYNCTSLTSIVIRDGVITIDSDVFSNCTSLTSITIPKSVTSIGTNAFINVPSTCVMYVKSGWNKKIATNAKYKGTFVDY